MKVNYAKREEEPYFLHNYSNSPEIVLIFPVTRDISQNSAKWRGVINFVEASKIGTLLVIDKTETGAATDFFMNTFNMPGKQLIVFPRSIRDTLFDSVGEIILDDNMWVIQLHDDDKWNGKLELPAAPNPNSVYFSDFYLESHSNGLTKIQDFTMPNRIVFSLVPTMLWNRFSKLIQAQDYHVAGSFDFTLNLMARSACKFEYQSGFEYFWKDNNWDTKKNSIAHLVKLAENDGWEEWSSPDIAIFNRSIDSLASLNYTSDLLDSGEITNLIQQTLASLKPSKKRRLKYRILIPILSVLTKVQRIFRLITRVNVQNSGVFQTRLSLYKFMKKTWQIETIDDVIGEVDCIQSLGGFENLQARFLFWRAALKELKERI